MFSNIRGRFNRRGGKVRLILAALVCSTGLTLGAGGTAVVAQIAGGNPTPNTENYAYCKNEGSSYTCTPVPVKCSGDGGCVSLAGTTVCDDQQSVEGCQSAFFASKGGPAPDYPCQMQATYTGNCVNGACSLGLAIPGTCPGKLLAQCQ